MSEACEPQIPEAARAALDEATQAAAKLLDTLAAGYVNVLRAHPDLAVHAVAAQYLAYFAGALSARGEFIAFNTGADEKAVMSLCMGGFAEGRADAYAQQEASGGIIKSTALAPGAVQ